MSDTPETDAAQHEGLLRTNPIPMQVVTANFARKLERERNKASQQYDNLAAEHMLAVNKFAEERDEARADAAKIADILSGLELRSTEELARLEQERNEARAVADELASVAAHCLGWHEHESPDAAIKIAAAVKRWKKMRREL
jgi:hypothetical protein